MSLRTNVVANAVGQALNIALSLAFLPLYIHYLGLEAYGLVGLFAMMTAWLQLLDLGMGPAVNREVARFTAGMHSPESIADLLRSLVVIALGMALLIGMTGSVAASWVATRWVQPGALSVETITLALAIMAWVLGVRLVEGVYRGAVTGLQRHVEMQSLSAGLSVFRWAGAAAVLAWVNPSVEIFFLWQGLSSVLSLAVFAVFVERSLPRPNRPARFSIEALESIRHFAGGVIVTMALAMVLSQGDKLILSKILTLEEFGLYAFCGTVAASLCQLVSPIAATFFPRFSELNARQDEAALSRVYHLACQLAVVVLFPATWLMIVFGERVMLVWTGDPSLARSAAPLIAVLAAGYALNSIMQIPYMLQLAAGWSSLAARTNIAAVTVAVPALLVIAPSYGGIGAAWIWVALNASYVLLMIPIMHRRLLPADQWRWMLFDLAIPGCAVAAAGLCLVEVLPVAGGRVMDLAVMVVAGSALTLVAIASTPLLSRALKLLESKSAS